MGQRCKHFPLIGEPLRLGPYHKSPICDRCRAAGYTPEDALTSAPNAAPDRDLSARQDWKCEVCGRPAVARYSGWKPLFAADSEIDTDPSEVFFCQEHLEHLYEVGSITVISSVDAQPSPPEEVFGAVFKAAKVLFREGITDENLIIPTLAFANQASAQSELQTLRDRFADIADDPGYQEQFANDFQQRFRGLTPISISDDVLILRSIPLSPRVSKYPGTTIVKEIEIDVFARSVTPEEVERRYTQTLVQEGVPYNEPRTGFCGFHVSDTHVSIVVIPRKEPLDSRQAAWHSSRGRQLTFPPPELVRKFYRSIKGSVYGGKVWGVSHILRGRQSGVAAQADNHIPACVAWYLRERGGIADDHRLATLLNRELLAKNNKPEVSVKSGEAVWKSIDKVGDSIKWTEFTLQMGL
jgi:hypothetical protein